MNATTATGVFRPQQIGEICGCAIGHVYFACYNVLELIQAKTDPRLLWLFEQYRIAIHKHHER